MVEAKRRRLTVNFEHWRRLVRTIGRNQNIVEAKSGNTDESIGASQLLGSTCPGCLPQVYAYDFACFKVDGAEWPGDEGRPNSVLHHIELSE